MALNYVLRTQGPQPEDQDQKLWAPLNYYVFSVSGNVVGLIHKVGAINLRINYGVKSIVDFMGKFIDSTLTSLIDNKDKGNASR